MELGDWRRKGSELGELFWVGILSGAIGEYLMKL